MERAGQVLFLSTGYLVLALWFGCWYRALVLLRIESLGQVDASFLDCLYFSVVTLATVGHGDLWPRSGPGKVLVMAEIVLGLLWTGLLVGLVLRRAGRGQPSGD